VLLSAGRRLAEQHVALAAAAGLTELKVRRRVRIAVFSTGDEIVEPGTPRPAPALFDANRYLLTGLIERLGALPTDLGILPDDPGTLAQAIASAAAGHDLVLTSGGVSTGEADHVRNAVESVGKLVFWRVGARHSSGCPATRSPHSLPSRAWCARCCCDSPAPRCRRSFRCRCVRLSPTGRRPAAANMCASSSSTAPTVRSRPSSISSLTETDGLVELPEDATKVEPGSAVGFLSYATLAG
jgi:molybdopterin molybdotransferase